MLLLTVAHHESEIINGSGGLIYSEFAFALTPSIKKHRGKPSDFRPVTLTCIPNRLVQYIT